MLMVKNIIQRSRKLYKKPQNLSLSQAGWFLLNFYWKDNLKLSRYWMLLQIE